jgi:hypothetical protein
VAIGDWPRTQDGPGRQTRLDAANVFGEEDLSPTSHYVLSFSGIKNDVFLQAGQYPVHFISDLTNQYSHYP